MTGSPVYVNLETAIAINEAMAARFGGSTGVRDGGLLESALAQPRQSFAGKDLYPSLVEKGARLAFGIVGNHPFVDGNKRTAAAAMAAFLEVNGMAFNPPRGDLADTVFKLAAGELAWEEFVQWVGESCS